MAKAKPMRHTPSATAIRQLKKAREDKGWSQSELAKKAGVPRARIKRLECNELKSIDSGEYASICRKLGMLFQKSTSAPKVPAVPKKTTKKAPTPKATTPKSPRRTPTGRIDRKWLRKELEGSGLLDLTLRELLAS